MKSKLLMSAIAMPAALALGSASLMAQDSPPPPSQAPVERMPEATPAPTPVPAPAATPSTTETTAGTFSSAQSADEWRSSNIVGQAVYNKADEKVGDINELVLGPDGKISHAVIGVGGFLGMGEKLVAVQFSDLVISRNADNKVRITLDSTKDALQNAPDYVYYGDKRAAE